MKAKLAPVIAEELHLDPETVRAWLKRFSAQGGACLEDAARPGRPATNTADEVGAVVAAALSNPKSLELRLASLMLDRLAAYLNETAGLTIKRTRIDDILVGKGLGWRKQETWFSERVGPEFAKKMEASPDSTRNHPPKA